eukprot:3389084-Amphidinium_carterae.1
MVCKEGHRQSVPDQSRRTPRKTEWTDKRYIKVAYKQQHRKAIEDKTEYKQNHFQWTMTTASLRRTRTWMTTTQ